MSLKDYFTYLPGKAQCKIFGCKKPLLSRKGGNTTVMRAHLKVKHPNEWKKFKSKRSFVMTSKESMQFIESSTSETNKRLPSSKVISE